VTGGATLSTPCVDKVPRDIVYDFELNPANRLREIAFGAKGHLKTRNGPEILNMTGSATYSTTFMHTYLGNIVYKFDQNRLNSVDKIKFFVKVHLMTP